MNSRASRLRGRGWRGLGQGHLSKLSPQVLSAAVILHPGSVPLAVLCSLSASQLLLSVLVVRGLPDSGL